MEGLLLVVLIILIILAILYLVCAYGLPWFLKAAGLAFLVTMLTSCIDPTQTATPGTIGVSYDPPNTYTLPTETPEPPQPTPAPTETPVCTYDIQAWVNHPVNPNGIQGVSADISYCDTLLAGQVTTICVNDVCKGATTDQSGNASAEFERTWGVGAVPYSVCIDDAGTPVCLRSSFMAVGGE